METRVIPKENMKVDGQNYSRKLAQLNADNNKRFKEFREDTKLRLDEMKEFSDNREKKVEENNLERHRELEEDYKVSINKIRQEAKDKTEGIIGKYKHALEDEKSGRTRQKFERERTRQFNDLRDKFYTDINDQKEYYENQLTSMRGENKNRLDAKDAVYRRDRNEILKNHELDRDKLVWDTQNALTDKNRLHTERVYDLNKKNHEIFRDNVERNRRDLTNKEEAFRKNLGDAKERFANELDNKSKNYAENLNAQKDDYNGKVAEVKSDYKNKFDKTNNDYRISRENLIRNQKNELEAKQKNYVQNQADSRQTYKNSIADLRRAYENKEEYQEANKSLVADFNIDQHNKEVAFAKNIEDIKQEAQKIIDGKTRLYRDKLLENERNSAFDKAEMNRIHDVETRKLSKVFRENLKNREELSEKLLNQAAENKSEQARDLQANFARRVKQINEANSDREDKIFEKQKDFNRNKDRQHELEKRELLKSTTQNKNLDIKRLREHNEIQKELFADRMKAANKERDRSIRNIKIDTEKSVNKVTDDFTDKVEAARLRELENKSRQARLAEKTLADVNRINRDELNKVRDQLAYFREYAEGDDGGVEARIKAQEESYNKRLYNIKQSLINATDKFDDERVKLREDYNDNLLEIKDRNKKNLDKQQRDFAYQSLNKSLAADKKIKTVKEAARENIQAVKDEKARVEKHNKEQYNKSIKSQRLQMQEDLEKLKSDTQLAVKKMQTEFFDERTDIVKKLQREKFEEKANLKDRLLKVKDQSERNLRERVAQREDQIIKVEGQKQREIANIRAIMKNNYVEAQEHIADKEVLHKLKINKALEKERSTHEESLNNFKKNSNERISKLLIKNDQNLQKQADFYETQIRELKRNHKREKMVNKINFEKEIARIHKANKLEKEATVIQYEDKIAKVNDALARRKVIEGKTLA